MDEADLASYGIIGLIDAIERFEPLRNIKFETYAIPRIKGAIIDELRSIDWVPRSVRAKARAVEQSYSKLEATLHRTPTDAEVAADLEMTDAEFQTGPAEDLLRRAWWPSTRCSGAGTAPTARPWARPCPTAPPGPWTPSR